MATASRPQKRSIVEYLGSDGGHSCGYCKSSSGFVAPGMWAHQLTVQHLQVMLQLKYIDILDAYFYNSTWYFIKNGQKSNLLYNIHVHVVMLYRKFELIPIKFGFFTNF